MNHNILKLNNQIVQFDNPNKRYEELKYTLSNVKTETGRTVLYDNKKYKEYVRMYEIDMTGTSNVNTNHNLANFLLTKIEASFLYLHTDLHFHKMVWVYMFQILK